VIEERKRERGRERERKKERESENIILRPILLNMRSSV